MTNSNTPLRKLMNVSVLALLGTICVLGIGALEGVCEDRIPSETEEAKELSELGDADHLCAIVDHQVTLIHGHCFDEWLHTGEDNALLNHTWRWCSRGPPTA